MSTCNVHTADSQTSGIIPPDLLDIVLAPMTDTLPAPAANAAQSIAVPMTHMSHKDIHASGAFLTPMDISTVTRASGPIRRRKKATTHRQPNVWYIHELAAAIKNNNLEKVTHLYNRYPRNVWSKSSPTQYVTTEYHPIYLAAVHGHHTILDKLLRGPSSICSPRDLVYPRNLDFTVFETLLSEKNHLKRIDDTAVRMIIKNSNGHLWVHRKLTRTGRIAIANMWPVAMHTMHALGMFEKQCHVLFAEACRYAASHRNFVMLDTLVDIGKKGHYLTTKLINSIYKSMYNGPSSPKGLVHDRANITICVVLLWHKKIYPTQKAKYNIDVAYGTMTNWYLRTINTPMTKPLTLLEVAAATNCTFLLHKMVQHSNVVYTAKMRRDMCKYALTRTIPHEDYRFRAHFFTLHKELKHNNPWAQPWRINTHKFMSKGTRDAVRTFLLCLMRLATMYSQHATLFPCVPKEVAYCILESGVL